MLVNYSEVPKARRSKLLERHIALSMDACDVLGGGGMSSGYRYPVGRAVYGYTVYRVYRVYRIRLQTLTLTSLFII